jgi:hypothetical protein
MSSIKVLDPTGFTRGGELPLAPRLTGLRDMSLAFYNNGKWNAGLLLESVAGAVRDEHGDGVQTAIREYDNLAHYAEDAETTAYIEDLSSYDAVVLALGD